MSLASLRPAASIASLSVCTELTRPQVSARSEPTKSAVYAISRAIPGPTMRSIRCSVPRSATMPILASRIENVASLEQMRTSAQVMRSTPPPMQWPWTAAITGFLHLRTSLKSSCHCRSFLKKIKLHSASLPPSRVPMPAAAFRSKPAVNILPSAQRRTTLTLSSTSRARKARPTSVKNRSSMTFSFLPRASTTSATPSATSTRRRSYPV
mmetsp:Transcript_17218/g.67013  ORF Transcript_17218/g.67013 Transcript_17218/m.67013 type:complete len:210 (-) Transcript_17218:42-671(-)